MVIVHVRIGGIEDEPHVRPVEEVFTPKHGRVLVEQGRLQAPQVIGLAIHLLHRVILGQPDDVIGQVAFVTAVALQHQEIAILAAAHVQAR
ncbi:hypothetical protein D3C78_1618500 [compost metagenome]